MDFPTLYYRTPGPHRRGPDGYAYIGVNDQAEARSAIDKGYFPTLDEAAAGKLAEAAIEAASELRDAVKDVKGPARDALEAEAKRMGVSFNWKTSDTALAERIAAKEDQ